MASWQCIYAIVRNPFASLKILHLLYCMYSGEIAAPLTRNLLVAYGGKQASSNYTSPASSTNTYNDTRMTRLMVVRRTGLHKHSTCTVASKKFGEKLSSVFSLLPFSKYRNCASVYIQWLPRLFIYAYSSSTSSDLVANFTLHIMRSSHTKKRCNSPPKFSIMSYLFTMSQNGVQETFTRRCMTSWKTLSCHWRAPRTP